MISSVMKCYKCTCYEVCILAGEVVLCLEVNFPESDEGKDGDVIADADQTDEPKTGWKDQNVAEMNLKFKRVKVSSRFLFFNYCSWTNRTKNFHLIRSSPHKSKLKFQKKRKRSVSIRPIFVLT